LYYYDEGFPVVGDALVSAINALIGECMTDEALAEILRAPEAPACTLAVLKCILAILGDTTALQGTEVGAVQLEPGCPTA
jgi:hypothetical protein